MTDHPGYRDPREGTSGSGDPDRGWATPGGTPGSRHGDGGSPIPEGGPMTGWSGSGPASPVPPSPGAPPPGGHPVPGGQPEDPRPTTDWHRLPPEQLARMHRPGVVPLRPLNLGDIFTGALQTMLRNPEATIGMGLLVQLVTLVPTLLGSVMMTRALAGVAQEDIAVLTVAVGALFSLLASITLTGMIMHVIGEAVLGDRASLAETWDAVKGRLPALIGTVLLVSVLTVAIVVGGILAVTLLVWALAGAGAPTALAVGAAVLSGLAVLGAVIYLSCRLSLAPAPVVLERVGPWAGIRRAWALTTGRQGVRVAGITLLAGLLVAIFTTMISVPISMVVTALLVSGGQFPDEMPLGVTVVDHLLEAVIGALTIPFTAGVTALLYLDQRMRREGLDVALVHAAQDRAARRSV